MLDKTLKFLVSDFEKLNERKVAFYFFVATFLLRFPFFFRDYVDRDESTFILLGQSWADGHLPYTELWDIKPPLTFAFFAAVIYLFGKSFIAIRLAGTLLISITAYFTYKIGSTISSKKVAIWSAMGCIALQSLFGSIQGVMSEHICMTFFMIAIYFFIKKKNSLSLLFVGLLMGISLMVKLNLAYAALFIGLYAIYFFIDEKRYGEGFIGVGLYGIGIIMVILLTILPYYLEGLENLWWKSNFKAPVDYANARRYSIFKLMPLFMGILAFLLFSWKKKYLDFKNRTVQILTVAIFGVLVSFVKAGRINSHYLIQLYPCLVILVGIVISKFDFLKKAKVYPLYLIILLLVPAESYLEYYRIVKHKIEKGTFYNGEGFSAPKYILENNLDTDNILFLGYHIGYWVLDVKPPTKAATHPSNLTKDEMFAAYENPRKNAMDEVRYIMDSLRPKTIVVRKNRRVFDQKEIVLNTYIDAYLLENYEVRATVEKAEILQRLE
ncbi:ArnT family glycosyltransferase [Maribacter sp. 2304DJ31-5]|uniref:ArnT family glycosyltransferase n=1 Tax=Maribacter sp. 2304DJ31-5 TaxID=3386273 RepID=UPI0039BCC589